MPERMPIMPIVSFNTTVEIPEDDAIQEVVSNCDIDNIITALIQEHGVEDVMEVLLGHVDLREYLKNHLFLSAEEFVDVLDQNPCLKENVIKEILYRKWKGENAQPKVDQGQLPQS